MVRTKIPLQGVGIIAFGIFFLILISILNALNYVKSNRLLIFDALSILLIIIGVVIIVLSKRTQQHLNKKT